MLSCQNVTTRLTKLNINFVADKWDYSVSCYV